jgi:hypothetical protein
MVHPRCLPHFATTWAQGTPAHQLGCRCQRNMQPCNIRRSGTIMTKSPRKPAQPAAGSGVRATIIATYRTFRTGAWCR